MVDERSAPARNRQGGHRQTGAVDILGSRQQLGRRDRNWCPRGRRATSTFEAVGASFTGVTVSRNVSNAESVPSLAMTLKSSEPLKLSGGVPEKVRVAALNVSQLAGGAVGQLGTITEGGTIIYVGEGSGWHWNDQVVSSVTLRSGIGIARIGESFTAVRFRLAVKCASALSTSQTIHVNTIGPL